ncbi:Clp protease/crotonase-like domain-containing protein [Natrinema salaciae]|uniref:hypothetical protein n=1 Tax=Natrinema salaciae TaxID=1186196 RepID=UPI0011132FE8|nr:hypothetical protein [Natrinema salaciae]
MPVTDVSNRDTTDERARGWADSVVESAPLGMESGRRMVSSALEMPLDTGPELEREFGATLPEIDDHAEGFAAGLENREPEFDGN